MNALVHNYEAIVSLTVEAAQLHCSYLLAGKTIATGSTRQIHHHFIRKHQPFAAKLAFLEGIYKNTEAHDKARECIKAYKDFKKIKHPHGSVIAAHKRLQKVLEKEFENQLKDYFEVIDQLRLISVGALATHGYFDWYHLDDAQWQMPGEKHADVVEMMETLPSQGGDMPTLFLLPLNLFGPAIQDKWTHNDPIPDSLKPFSFLHTTFLLPNLSLLSLDELHAVKMQLQEPATAFHQSITRWAEVCRQPQIDDSLSFFQNEVLPAAERFQTAMDENFILNQHVKAGNDKLRVSFGLGEISLAAIWDIFRKHKMIPDEDWAKLQAKADDPKYKTPMPVLIFEGFFEEFDEESSEEVSLKKSLCIED